MLNYLFPINTKKFVLGFSGLAFLVSGCTSVKVEESGLDNKPLYYLRETPDRNHDKINDFFLCDGEKISILYSRKLYFDAKPIIFYTTDRFESIQSIMKRAMEVEMPDEITLNDLLKDN
ncbi:MAG TPA: hypothetical protein VJB94_01175 [Candidatus Nanoarchaeia archaeon]|nr:hypothetical protein [Candidatus Nanoarchaeia archaeon]